MDDDDDSVVRRRRRRLNAVGPRRYRSPIFPGLKRAPRNYEMANAPRLIRPRKRERDRGKERERRRDQRVDTTHEGGTVLLGNGYFVDDSVVAVGINVGLPKHRETRASANCA